MICRSLALLLAVLSAAASAQETPLTAPPAEGVAVAQAATPQPSAEDLAFGAFVRELRARALAEGVTAGTFDRETAGLAFNPRVVRFDRAQPGGSPGGTPGVMAFAPYRRTHVDRPRIDGGRRRYQELAATLAGNQARTGVPGDIALAIFGHETGYGSVTGDFDLIRSLASLAFEGRRRELFTAELIATLKLIDRGFPRTVLKGSWAGATGYPQFLPSVYLRLGTDGDGDGRADIWRSQADALASIAAYLREAGWKANLPWAVPVIVPGSLDRASLRSPLVSPRCPRVHQRHSRWLTIAEWKKRGLLFAGARMPGDAEFTSLIEPDGPGETAYLLTTNYRSILDYNCSNFYALSVGLLADEIAR
jgi:membrane-bound lytic murein transglycosylase B